MNNMARECGLIKRVRKVKARHLLDMLLFESGCSYRQQAIQLAAKFDLQVSRQALHQKHNEHFLEFVKSVFDKLLLTEIDEREIEGMEIKVKDSTRFALPGVMTEKYPGANVGNQKSGACVQFEFGIKSGKSDIKLTAATKNDQNESRLDQDAIEPSVLYLRDLGYSHQSYMANIIDKGAYFINKLLPSTLIYRKNDKGEYTLLDLSSLSEGVYDQTVYLSKKKFPVRIIITRVDEKLRKNRIANIEKNNRWRGATTSDNYKERAAFNFIVTNLPVEKYSAELIQKLYHLRWQIELVFKAWKSILNLADIPAKGPYTIECILYGKLIWALLSWKISMSLGKIGDISVGKVHQVIEGSKEMLRKTLYSLCQQWFRFLEKIPLSSILVESKKGRLVTNELILTVC
jgi:hypothetical protein